MNTSISRFALVMALSVGLVLGSVQQTQAQVSGGAGGGFGGVAVIDLSSLEEVRQAVDYMNQQLAELDKIMNINEEILNSLGLGGNGPASLIFQGVMELVCGKFQLPQFDFYYNININLPDLPDSLCDWFGFGAGYRSNFWQRVTGSVLNATIFNENNHYTNPAVRDRAGQVIRHNRDVPTTAQSLAIRRNRQVSYQNIINKAMAIGMNGATVAGDYGARIKQAADTAKSSKSLRGDIQANTAALITLMEVNQLIAVQLATLNELLATERLQTQETTLIVPEEDPQP